MNPTQRCLHPLPILRLELHLDLHLGLHLDLHLDLRLGLHLDLIILDFNPGTYNTL